MPLSGLLKVQWLLLMLSYSASSGQDDEQSIPGHFAWTSLNSEESINDPSARPHRRYSSAMAATTRGELVVTHGYVFDGQARWLDDTWIFGEGRWREVSLATQKPSPRYGHSLNTVADGSDRMVLFGGESDVSGGRFYEPTNVNDVWVLSWNQEQASWRRLDVQDSQPVARAAHACFSAGTCLYVFGGSPGPMGDMWRICLPAATSQEQLDAVTWQQLSKHPESKIPSPRFLAAMSSNSDGTAAYVFGGFGSASTNLADLWRYNIATDSWEHLATADTDVAPSSRVGHVAAWITGRLVVYGGARCEPMCRCLSDVWQFDEEEGSWRQLQPVAATRSAAAGGAVEPPARYRHSAALLGESLVVFGGESYRFAQDYHNDLWQLRLASAAGDAAQESEL